MAATDAWPDHPSGQFPPPDPGDPPPTGPAVPSDPELDEYEPV